MTKDGKVAKNFCGLESCALSLNDAWERIATVEPSGQPRRKRPRRAPPSGSGVMNNLRCWFEEFYAAIATTPLSHWLEVRHATASLQPLYRGAAAAVASEVGKEL